MKKRKKIIILLFLLFLTVGCQEEKEIKEYNLNENEEEVETNLIEEYVDLNPIKISLYTGNNGKYTRQDTFYSKLTPFKEIGIFSIILSQDEIINGSSIKNLYHDYKKEYENFSQYKVGYSIEFTLENGETFQELILEPREFSEFSFHNYLYVWLYDDVNTTGWHSHLTKNDFQENTVMSSIKLMATNDTKQIITPIQLTVFTYDEDDFDEDGNYRGISKFTTKIEREE